MMLKLRCLACFVTVSHVFEQSDGLILSPISAELASRYLDGRKTDLAIVNVGLFIGYNAVVEDLDRVKIIPLSYLFLKSHTQAPSYN